jgi:hypothetical protein
MRCEGLSITDDGDGLEDLKNAIEASIKKSPEDDKRSHFTESLEKILSESKAGIVDKLHSLCALYKEIQKVSSTSTVGSYGKIATGSLAALGLVGLVRLVRALTRKLKNANKKVNEAEVNLENIASTGTTGEIREARADLVVANDRANEVLNEANAVVEQVPRGAMTKRILDAIRNFRRGNLRTATQGGKRKGKGKATRKRKH